MLGLTIFLEELLMKFSTGLTYEISACDTASFRYVFLCARWEENEISLVFEATGDGTHLEVSNTDLKIGRYTIKDASPVF